MTTFFERHDPILGLLYGGSILFMGVLTFITRKGIDIAIGAGYLDFVLWMSSVVIVCVVLLVAGLVRP